MRGSAIFFFVLIFASQAAAVGLGFTVSPRLLFPLYYPYEFEEEDLQQGVMAGFSVSFDLLLFPGFTVGPYLGCLFSTDTDTVPYFDSDIESKCQWSDLLIGAAVRFAVPTGSPWRPRMSVALGYAPLSFLIRYEYPWGTYETDGSGGGFGLDAGLGVDYRISEVITIGFGADFHLNTADKLEREVDGETLEFELEESPVGLGFAFDVGISL